MEHAHMYCHGWHFFPTVFFILMVIFFIVMYRRRKYGWGWRCLGNKWMYGPTNMSRRYESAMEILKKRYAGGEISKEEFGHIQKELNDLKEKN